MIARRPIERELAERGSRNAVTDSQPFPQEPAGPDTISGTTRCHEIPLLAEYLVRLAQCRDDAGRAMAPVHEADLGMAEGHRKISLPRLNGDQKVQSPDYTFASPCAQAAFRQVQHRVEHTGEAVRSSEVHAARPFRGKRKCQRALGPGIVRRDGGIWRHSFTHAGAMNDGASPWTGCNRQVSPRAGAIPFTARRDCASARRRRDSTSTRST